MVVASPDRFVIHAVDNMLFVEITRFEFDVEIELAYATDQNFMGVPIYRYAHKVLVGRVGEFNLDVKFESRDLNKQHIVDGMYHKPVWRCYYHRGLSG